MRTLFEPHIEMVGKVMDMQLERQNVITSNIANVKTPKYRPLELEFEQQLQDALDTQGKLTRTHKNHIPSTFDPETFNSNFGHAFKPRTVHGEDRVNIDKEMANMAKVNLQYSTLTTVVAKAYEGTSTIIQEGSK